MTRVLEVIHGLTAGGAESALMRRLKYRPAGIGTTIMCATAIPGFRIPELAEADVRCEQHPLSFRDRAWWRKLVADVDPDVIVSHSPRETLPLLYWNRGTRIPLVVVAHHPSVTDDPRLRTAKELAFRVVNGRADLHIAVSQAVADAPPCSGARRVAVHMLGSELQPPEPGTPVWPAGTRLRLMTLSRLAWFKNLPALVEAAALVATELRQADAHIAVVGSGPEQHAIAESISALGLSDVVSMHAQVANPTWLLEETDVLISCSTAEGGPLTLFEASLAGARLLATPTGVAPDVLDADAGSVLAKSSSPADLAEALSMAIALGPVSPDERRTRRADAQRWQSERQVPEFYRLLESVIDTGGVIPG